MPTYLVEIYAPGTVVVDDLAERAVVVARASPGVHYLRSIFVPEDETCFHLFDAASPEALRAAGREAGIEFPRILEAVCIDVQETTPVALAP